MILNEEEGAAGAAGDEESINGLKNKPGPEKNSGKFVGFLRRTSCDEVELTWKDRKMMKALTSLPTQQTAVVYVRMSDMKDSTSKGIKYKVEAYLLELKNAPSQWRRVPIRLPNLGTFAKSEYLQVTDDYGDATNELVANSAALDNLTMNDENNLFSSIEEKFMKEMKRASRDLEILQSELAGLDDEVNMMREHLARKVERSEELKLVKGLQGDAETAVKAALTLIRNNNESKRWNQNGEKHSNCEGAEVDDNESDAQSTHVTIDENSGLSD